MHDGDTAAAGIENQAAAAIEETRYRLLIDALTDYAIYMLDPDGVVITWNAGATRLTGYRADEVLHHHYRMFHTPGEREAGLPEEALRIALREGRVQKEGWRLRKDGTRLWAHVVIDPVRSPAGELLGFAKITRDLTEQRAAEEALSRTEQEFRLLVQGVSDYAIYMLDPNGRITNWNLGAERIKGYRPSEVIGEHFSKFYTEEDRARGEPARALSVAAAEGRFEKEGWRVRRDGTRFLANVVIDPIRDEAGTLLGFAKVTRDITERVAAQQALEEAREAFFQAQKMEAIGQLGGGIAHDFNNLLMAVIGSLELLRKRLPDDARSRQLLENALQGAERGAALTSRMLAFARRQDLDPTATDLGGLVDGMTELLKRSLGPQIDLETQFPAGLEPVMADRNQLELALLNLAVNARDAMPEGGRIVIGARRETIGATHPSHLPPGDYVCLWLADSGSGMDTETLAHATEPFFTTKGVGKGTGLGLSMVHGLAEQLHGRLTLHSAPDAGTTVEIRLPVAQEAEQRPAEPAPADPGLPLAPAKLKVLAVDDDALVLMNTSGMLEDLGHRVFEATSAQQALDLFEREPQIDLIITDQAMPQMTGLQLATEVRTRRPGMPVIIATGYAELPAGGNQSFPKLDKPFFEQQLAQAIRAAMQPR